MVRALIILLVAATFAGRSFGYVGIDSQYADTTSGWKIVYTSPFSGHAIAALQFPSKDTGYAGTYNGVNDVLLRSTDAGITWDTMPTPIPSGPITFVTAKIGFCGGGVTNKVVWKTTDGGNTWTPYPENSIATGPIVFGNQDTGVILSSTVVARTTDGGVTWYEAYPSGMTENGGAAAPDGKTFFGVGLMGQFAAHLDWPQAGYFQKSTDGGATWIQLYTGIPADLWGCYAVTPNLVFVCGARGYVGKSTDGGNTWDTMYVGPGIPTYSNITFLDSLHGFVEGTGAIAYTSDGGSTWTPQYFPNTPWLEGIAMFNDSEAVTCGSAYIYRTKTMGMFSSVSQRQNPNFQVQVFPNPTSGLVTIQYTLPSASEVSFRYFDANGVTLKQISAAMQSTGVHETTFDASSLASGVYYFTMTTGQGEYHGKIEVAK